MRHARCGDFREQLNRLTPHQNTTSTIGRMGGDGTPRAPSHTGVQTLIGRIRNAAQGYSGFFDAVRVKEDDLDKLEQFDQQLVGEIAKVSASIDALDAAVQAGTEVKPAIANTRSTIQEVVTLFNKRASVITGQ